MKNACIYQINFVSLHRTIKEGETHRKNCNKDMKNFALYLFRQNYTKTVGKYGKERTKKNARYRREFGNTPVMQAYAQFKEEYEKRCAENERISSKMENFEKYLISQNAKCVQSNKSESRYYTYNGRKYRFSAHVYPTGSMTNELLGVVDLCADSYLIDKIEKELNLKL